MTAYELLLPLSDHEAKKRRVPKGTANLLVLTDNRDDVEDRLSKFIHVARMDSRFMIAQTMTMFMSTKKLKAVLEQRGFRYRFDSEISSEIRLSQNIIVDCPSADDIAYVLKKINTEAIVFYGEANVGSNSDVQRRIVEAGRDGYIESPFLKMLDVIPVFVFYSATHASIEIFGVPEAVKRLFLVYCEHNM